MSGITFLSENLTDSATFSITTGAENAQFPLTNLVNNTTTKKFRSVGNDVVIVVDLLQTRTIDTIAVVGDTIGTFGITQLIAKTSVTLDFSSSTPNFLDLSSEQNIGYSFITEVNHRYVEITLTGTGSYAEISKLFIGEKINLPELSLSIDSFEYGYKDLSKAENNEYGQRFVNRRNKIKMLKGGFDFTTKSEQEILDDMFLRHGISLPLWIILDPNSDAINDGKYKLSMYAYVDVMPDWKAAGGQQYNSTIELSEVV